MQPCRACLIVAVSPPTGCSGSRMVHPSSGCPATVRYPRVSPTVMQLLVMTPSGWLSSRGYRWPRDRRSAGNRMQCHEAIASGSLKILPLCNNPNGFHPAGTGMRLNGISKGLPKH
ncbi:MAG: hypothetical protein OXC57_09860 [Rhodobacteraceae bacterium]|nr:hypothetical protein [Paracoccaceae bacterium]